MTNYPYIHLRTQSSYSLAESALKIKHIIQLTKENKMPSIALTDNNNLFGALEFAIECVHNGIQPIIGSSLNLLDIQDKHIPSQINLLVKNEEGYKNLLYLSSISHIKQDQVVGIRIKDLKNHSNGLLCYIGGEFNPLLLLKLQNKQSKINDFISIFLELFSTNFLFEIQRINNNQINDYEHDFITLSQKNKIPLISSNNVKFSRATDYNAHDALLCIAQKATINQEKRIISDPETYFKTSEQMYELFKDIPDVIENNFKIALMCQFYPKEISPKLPKFFNDEKLSEEDLLIINANKGLLEKINFYNLKNPSYKKRLA